MRVAALKGLVGGGFVYLASPYSSHPEGLEAAFQLACQEAAMFVRAKVPVFSPVVHSHSVAVAGDIDPASHAIWLPMDVPMLRPATIMVVVDGPGRRESKGIAGELTAALALRMPVWFKEPGVDRVVSEELFDDR